ncbi:MAG TPA: HTTM domain-containing protein, partial [Polyangiales bacterium]|nr:HTTM domain-containing protein [Polyangiales bacterium]
LARAHERLSAPVDAASLGAFRALLGVVLLVSIVRALEKDVVAQGFVAPQYFFPYYGLAWLPAPGAAASAIYGVLALLGLGLTLGVYTRLAAALFALGFSYLHFVDVTHYLNHYYLVTLLTGLLALVPIGASAPRWGLWLFRFQVGVVYFFGGVAKLRHDWLFAAEPLRTWLAANTDLPLLGPLFALRETAFVMSWLGAAYDSSIVFLLLWRRTRPFAYLAVLAFHLLTARLFQIGLFPWMMMVASLLFLSPSWPRRFASFSAFEPRAYALPRWLALYVAWQLLVPLRHWLYPGNVLWSEQGYRWSWNVMLMEKTGSAEFRVVHDGQQRTVFPRKYLTQAQDKMMATQPDMILQFAHFLAQRHDAAVYADVWVSLNGRQAARLIDPGVDLARETDTLANKPWILPAPD